VRSCENDEVIDYVLTDFMMPKKNGLNAISEILKFVADRREAGHKCKMPRIVFLTAFKTANFAQALERMEIEALILEKPLTIDELSDILQVSLPI